MRHHGRIVLVASTAGQRGEAYHADYGASKGAMIAFVKSLAPELAKRDITVNSVAPGWVDTEMCEIPFAGGGRAAIERGIPLGRIAAPRDIAGPIVFLCSELARHITGEIVNVNGGSVLLRMIVIIFTGGTISMRTDPIAGGAIPALAGKDILALVPGIEQIAPLEVEDFAALPGPHMTVERAWALRERIAAHLARPEVDGVVVTHGTDALEESAYLVARSLATTKPVVFTGAMRTSNDAGWDGPSNLTASVRVAANTKRTWTWAYWWCSPNRYSRPLMSPRARRTCSMPSKAPALAHSA